MTKYSNFSGKVRVESSNPSNPVEGDEYYNEDQNTWMRYNGTNWVGVEVQTSTTTTTTTSTTTSTSTTTTA